MRIRRPVRGDGRQQGLCRTDRGGVGTGPGGYDCSGLVYASYRYAGIRLPRTTYGMLRSWRLVRIAKSNARRGDLAFFGPGHVELFDRGAWTYGAADSGTRIGFHRMNRFWHPTMYFRVR